MMAIAFLQCIIIKIEILRLIIWVYIGINVIATVLIVTRLLVMTSLSTLRNTIVLTAITACVVNVNYP